MKALYRRFNSTQGDQNGLHVCIFRISPSSSHQQLGPLISFHKATCVKPISNPEYDRSIHPMKPLPFSTNHLIQQWCSITQNAWIMLLSSSFHLAMSPKLAQNLPSECASASTDAAPVQTTILARLAAKSGSRTKLRVVLH
jgi:hypothetical protein